MYKTRFVPGNQSEDSAFIVDSRFTVDIWCIRHTFRCSKSISSLMLKLRLNLYNELTIHSQKCNQHVTKTPYYPFGKLFPTDSNTCLSKLKWKTDQSRIKFCCYWIFSFPMLIIQRKKLKFPLVLISLVVPTEPRQVNTLRYKKTHIKI